MNTIWKDILGFDGWYQVSNKGDVRSWIKRGRKRDRLDKPYTLKQWSVRGYKYALLRKDNKNIRKRVHRLVACAFIPNPEDKPQVNHKNGIKDDNRVENLEWVTRSENQKHACRIGLHDMSGENSPRSKIKENDVTEIKRIYNDTDMDQYEIAELYGIDQSSVSKIVNNKSWTCMLNE